VQLKETQWGTLELIHLAQDRKTMAVFIKTVVDYPIPENEGNLSSSDNSSFSSKIID
jgi:hypothetical protein